MRTHQPGCPILLYCPHPGELCRGPLTCARRKEVCQAAAGTEGLCGWELWAGLCTWLWRSHRGGCWLSTCFTFSATAHERGLCSHEMNPVERWGCETRGRVQSPVGLGAGCDVAACCSLPWCRGGQRDQSARTALLCCSVLQHRL